MDETRNPPYFFPSALSSLILHAGIVGIIYYLLSQVPDMGSKTEPIQVDLTNEKTAAKIVPQHQAKGIVKSNSDRATHARSVSLSDLGMRLDTSRPAESSGAPVNTPPSEAMDQDEWDVMNPDPRVARFNQYIYNTVQGWLDRDSRSRFQEIYGTVRVKITFDENGNYLEGETIYDAIDPNFQSIVARALRNSFAVPIPRPFLYVHKKFSIERMVVIRHF